MPFQQLFWRRSMPVKTCQSSMPRRPHSPLKLLSIPHPLPGRRHPLALPPLYGDCPDCTYTQRGKERHPALGARRLSILRFMNIRHFAGATTGTMSSLFDPNNKMDPSHFSFPLSFSFFFPPTSRVTERRRRTSCSVARATDQTKCAKRFVAV
ncbi:hypothetical protein EDB85DRAFT_189017 [Lactarius pseudohatsudake]|nr:hypothetical protein EDB85DRAFT_189017 [Lactarius pseudohatsudake]